MKTRDRECNFSREFCVKSPLNSAISPQKKKKPTEILSNEVFEIVSMAESGGTGHALWFCAGYKGCKCACGLSHYFARQGLLLNN